MAINVPVYSWFTPFVKGMGLTYATTTTLTIAAGTCTNSTTGNVITVPSVVTLNAATVGAGGIDAGSLAASTMYAVYAIGNSRSYLPDANDESDDTNPYPGTFIISTSFTAPSMPANYDMYRYIGAVRTDGSSHLLKFIQTGTGVSRTIWYDVALSVLSGGTSATYAAVALDADIPAASIEVLILATVTPTGATDSVNLVPSGSTATVGYAILGSGAAGVAISSVLRLPCGSDKDIDYKVGGSVSLGVAGYIDQL